MSTLEILAFPTGFRGRGNNELTLKMLRNISATYWSIPGTNRGSLCSAEGRFPCKVEPRCEQASRSVRHQQDVEKGFR